MTNDLPTAAVATAALMQQARALLAAGQAGAAIKLLTGHLSRAPGVAALHELLGQALRAARRFDEATPQFERAVELAPQQRAYALILLLHRGTWLDEQGRAPEAMACFEQACNEHPQSADAWAALGTVRAYLGSPEDAEPCLRRALQLDGERPDLIERYGQVLQDMRRYENAALVFERLLRMQPQRPLLPGRLLHVKMLTADWTGLETLASRVIDAAARGLPATEPFGAQGFIGLPDLLHRIASQHAGRHFTSAMISQGRAPAPAVIGTGPKIRLGYVAGEFRNQATSVLLTEVLEMHDRERFEVFAFDNGWDDGSRLRQRIEKSVRMVSIRRVPDEQALAAIRGHGIDVLVNLNGYFGQARHGLFALRPAPVQVNYLGFPGTLGTGCIDYIVADRIVIPEEDRRHYTEQVVYLPGCYQPNDRQRPIADHPARRSDIGLPEDAFVFCCMNNVYKLLPAQFALWLRLMRAVPGSVLMLYSNVPEAQRNLRDAAQAGGVDPSRLHFCAPVSVAEHLARLRLADLFLDTLPYNAHTTGSDALWAGLPVLTCLGRAFPGRVGASLLHHVGLPELVTDSLPAYEAMALRLATEPGLLAGLRRRLAEHLADPARSPLFDTPRYTRHLEAAYVGMVERARAGLAPQSFGV